MKSFHPYYLFILLSSTATSDVPSYAKPGCNDTCGGVRIPFPFGIGANCSVNQWYMVDCNSSIPYLSALNHLEILGVDLGNQTVVVNMPIVSDCSNSSQTMSINLNESPFLFSRSHNKFVFVGCGNAVMVDNIGSVLTRCSTNCDSHTVSEKKGCLGITCCQTTISRYLKSYTMKISQLERHRRDIACGSAFLVDKNSYRKRKFFYGNSSIPTSLLWTLSEIDYDEKICSRANMFKVDLGNGDAMDSWVCKESAYNISERNPYLDYQYDYDQQIAYTELCERCRNRGGFCQNITICDRDRLEQKFICENTPTESRSSLDQQTAYTEKCERCRNRGGFCHNITTCEGDGSGQNFICENILNESRSSSLGIILGVSISTSVLFLVATSYASYKFIKKIKDKRQRKNFFKRNGGLLLKQQQSADSTLVDKTILFTSYELENATDNFNENRILGRGGQGTVYKGMLVDGRIVAVKKSKIVDECQLEQFINEVVILSQVNHRNVVKLLGCCLETEVPLLVSEFIPNGTLYDCIHNENHEYSISLNMRLQIATEVAGALAYLHSATFIPIYHRDIKTTNILLDDKYRAKISDFGTSRFVLMDQTHLTTLVKGTFGYLDPEYFQSSQFTEKSDVYSFGVVLVELLTGERPISRTQFGEYRSLAMHFMLAMEEGHVLSIFDVVAIKEGTRDELMQLANLAIRCLNMNGKNRPTMKQVVIELENIRTSHIPDSN